MITRSPLHLVDRPPQGRTLATTEPVSGHSHAGGCPAMLWTWARWIMAYQHLDRSLTPEATANRPMRRRSIIGLITSPPPVLRETREDLSLVRRFPRRHGWRRAYPRPTRSAPAFDVMEDAAAFGAELDLARSFNGAHVGVRAQPRPAGAGYTIVLYFTHREHCRQRRSPSPPGWCRRGPDYRPYGGDRDHRRGSGSSPTPRRFATPRASTHSAPFEYNSMIWVAWRRATSCSYEASPPWNVAVGAVIVICLGNLRDLPRTRQLGLQAGREREVGATTAA